MIGDKMIPANWELKSLGELCEIVSGNTPKGLEQVSNKGSYQFYKVSDMNLSGNEVSMNTSNVRLTEAEIKNLRIKVYPKGTVIFPKRGGAILTNKKRILSVASSFDLNVMGVLPNESVESSFLYYWFQKLDLTKIYDGSNVPQINNKNIAPLLFPLPTIKEQQKIVAKIEELFSEIDKGVEEIKTAQQQLKVYRQAVLKWAFEGKLTNEVIDEGELPNGWKQTKLGDIITKIEAGKSFKCDERPPKENEVGVLKVSAVTWGEFDEEESKTVTDSFKVNSNYFVNVGDFLFSRANTIELVGASVIVKHLRKKLMLSDKTLRIVFNDSANKRYILYYLRCKKGRDEIERLSTGNQESMRNIGQERIKQISIPYCTIEEQQRIVQEIESRLSVCDKIEETITNSLKQAEALRQSILKKAFEGKLVYT